MCKMDEDKDTVRELTDRFREYTVEFLEEAAKESSLSLKLSLIAAVGDSVIQFKETLESNLPWSREIVA